MEIGPPNDTAAARDERARKAALVALKFIDEAELVLWRSDLISFAETNAKKHASDLVTDADILLKHEFWSQYGQGIIPQIYGGTHALFQLLLISGAAAGIGTFDMAFRFLYPIEDSAIRLAKPPIIRLVPLLTVGNPPGDIEAQRLLACLSFRAKGIVQDEPAEINHTRVERRRMKREGRTPPTVRIINLRPISQTRNEKNDDQHQSRSPYGCQFPVAAHSRRIHKGTSKERVIQVTAHFKGPKDKPLKPPTQTVIVVKR